MSCKFKKCHFLKFSWQVEKTITLHKQTITCSNRSSPFSWFSRHSACCRIHPQPSWQFHGSQLLLLYHPGSETWSYVVFLNCRQGSKTARTTCRHLSNISFVVRKKSVCGYRSTQIYIASVILLEEAHNAHPTTRPHVLSLLFHAHGPWTNESSRAKKARETSEKCKGAKAIWR